MKRGDTVKCHFNCRHGKCKPDTVVVTRVIPGIKVVDGGYTITPGGDRIDATGYRGLSIDWFGDECGMNTRVER